MEEMSPRFRVFHLARKREGASCSNNRPAAWQGDRANLAPASEELKLVLDHDWFAGTRGGDNTFAFRLLGQSIPPTGRSPPTSSAILWEQCSFPHGDGRVEMGRSEMLPTPLMQESADDVFLQVELVACAAPSKRSVVLAIDPQIGRSFRLRRPAHTLPSTVEANRHN